MIRVVLRTGSIITLPTGTAVTFSTFPVNRPDDQPARSLDVLDAHGRQIARWRSKEIAGYIVGSDTEIAVTSP